MRNLGYDPVSGGDMSYAGIDVVPEDHIVAKRMLNGEEYDGSYTTNVYYDIDCSRVNEASLRYYTDKELVSHDEYSMQACLYKHFVCAPRALAVSTADMPKIGNNTNPKVIQQYLDGRDVNSFFNGYSICRTHWSFGTIGAYENKPRGRVFYLMEEDRFVVMVGKWLEEHPEARQLILQEFDLQADKTTFEYAVHWDIGKKWM